MSLPFSIEQFMGVFEAYNRAVWPAQIVAYILGIAAMLFAILKTRHSGRAVSGILGLFWLWTGIFYHLIFFTTVNPAARLFGALFVLQGLLFLWSGVFQSRLSFSFRPTIYHWTGALFVLYAMVLYPIFGAIQGHVYPCAPSFGITPCPATIFTFGLLLWSVPPIRKHLLIIPFFWSIMGASAAVSLGILDDFGLLAAGVIGTALLVVRDRKAGGRAEK